MPRKNRPRGRRSSVDPPRPLSGGISTQRTESGPDGDWIVRSVSGSQTTKAYRCPGCDHEINPGTPHVVTWPAEDYGTVEDRRHWHRGCWDARGRRGPTSRRR